MTKYMEIHAPQSDEDVRADFNPIRDRAQQIFALFEGICPRCGQDIKIVSVSGTPDWLEDFTFLGDHEITELPPENFDGPVGNVHFLCPDGHQDTATWGFGDWS